MLNNISLRHIIPILSFSTSLMLIILFYVVSSPVAKKEAFDLSKRQALAFLQIQQSRFIELLYAEDKAKLEKEIYFANNDPAIKRLFIVDENLTVKYANRTRYLGQSLQDTGIMFAKEEVRKVRDTLTLSINQYNSDSAILTGYAALNHMVEGEERRWSLIIVHDNSNLHNAIVKIAALPSELLATIMLLVSILATVLLRRHLESRLSPLQKAAENLAKNKKGARANLTGADEFADIGRSFDQMAAKIEDTVDELKQAKEEAEQANLAKNNFLSFMSHEIQTPLAGLLGFVDLLRETKLDEEARIYLKSTEASARTLSGLISNLLETSRLEAGTITPVSKAFCINSIIQDIIDSLIIRAKKKGISLKVISNQDDPIWLENDPTLIRKLLMNLLDNAIGYTQAGSVTIAIDSFPYNDNRTKLSIAIIDTGIGIAADEQKHMFDRFYRSRDDRIQHDKGAGIGLTICKDIADILNAKISVESILGKGSTFTFILETELSEPQSDFSYTSFTTKEQKPLNILLVEHSELTRSFLKSLLTKMGHSVKACETSEEAIQTMKELLIYPDRANIDLALIDIHMPVINGEETMHEIRGMDSAFKRLPIVATSTQNDPPLKEKMLYMGFNGFVSKPVDKKHLIEEIFKLSHLQTHHQ